MTGGEAADRAWYAEYRNRLTAQGIDVVDLDWHVAALLTLPLADLTAALARFDAVLDKLPFENDSDYGALLLENAAAGCAGVGRRRALLEAAVRRGREFARWASAGGEGLARMVDVRRIQAKLDAT